MKSWALQKNMEENKNPKITYIETVVRLSLILGVLNSLILLIAGTLSLLAHGLGFKYLYHYLWNENVFYNALTPLFIALILNTIAKTLKEMEKMV